MGDGVSDRIILLTAGPVSVEQDVLDTLSAPVIPHYGSQWIGAYRELLVDLQKVFQTGNDMFLVTGPGSSVLEMSISSVAAPGESVIVVNNGYFGKRMVELGTAHGLNVIEVAASATQRVGAEEVQAAFEQHPESVAVAVVQHDTTTGMQNDVKGITELAHEHGAVVIMDSVSSLGGLNIPVDEWGVDIAVTIANKCLAAAPGVAPIAVSPRAWEVVESKQTSGWYLNLRTWRHYAEDEQWGKWHPYPTTVATSLAMALRTAVKRLMDEGLPAVFERHAETASAVREGLRQRGFEMLLPEDESSPLLTSAYGLSGMNISHFMRWLFDERGLMVSGGLGDLSGKIFRVGHMGRTASLAVAERFLAAVDDYLAQHG